jgi:glutamate N-acetyltransferase / amino-acid N-acetyltransferase
MAVGLSAPSILPLVRGVRLGTCAAGLRYAGRRDLVVLELAAGSETAGVFTRNRFCAAPVTVARDHLASTQPRALLINTGYANAGTGKSGIDDARGCCQELAKALGCAPEQVLPFSTGVIGERLPVERLVKALPACLARLDEAGWLDAAHGIMTTDTMAKGAWREIKIGSQTVTVTGIAKGAGMIRPDMATLLAFIATDATVTREALRTCLTRAVAGTFNRITVDGDTSTNDAVLLSATGKSDAARIGHEHDQGYAQLTDAVNGVCLELAQAIVRDAEGASKFITIEVTGGASESDCLEVAYTVAHSPLVKTAFFASDPNWGRILAAVGRASIPALDVTAVSIFLNEVCVVSHGTLDANYTEAKGQAAMRKPEITVRIALASGPSSARIWTSDLSHEYVQINAEYRS